MAIKPTVFKVNLQIADMDRHYYEEHLLTIAQHPSETDERMMIRILAFALNANDNLTFAEAITDTNQADIWDRDLNEQIALWICVGLPDEKVIRKAVSRATNVIIYTYGGRVANMWWEKLKLNDYKNLKVVNLEPEDTRQLAAFAARGMKLNINIQEGDITVSDDSRYININPQTLKSYSNTH